jgi:TetR/AcrR family transcriptional regulator, regulator of cefoperazone and chloramphenicol sensitivity
MSRSSLPRHSPGHSYARGLEARQRIIDVAIGVFGNLGFENASTRSIARRAKVNLGSLRYYFGSKEKLYLACAEHIAVYGEGPLEAFASKIEATVAASDRSRERLLEIMRMAVETLLEHLVTPRRPSPLVMFVVREQMSPGPGYEIIYQRLTRRFIELWAGLVGRIVRRPASDAVSLLKTFCIMGQLFTFERNLHTVKRTLGWNEIDDKRLAVMKRVLWQQVQTGLSLRR